MGKPFSAGNYPQQKMGEKMKKTRLLFLCILTVVSACLLLAGCSNNDKVSAIYLKDHNPESAVETEVGYFDYSAHTLVISYNSGVTEERPLTEQMIAPEDLFKFYQEGEHEIAVIYGNQKYTFKVLVKRSSFSDLKFPENTVFTYDGKVHTVEVQGAIPANATITYIGGNSFVNAGTYDVTAIVSCEGYVTAKISTTVEIKRAKYDMSGITFKEKEYVYDGRPHSVEISGTLPKGVCAPTYTINGSVASSAVDVGTYTVRASFTNNDPNYENIPVMQTTLKITPAEYDPNVDIAFKDSKGNAISDLQKVYDGTAVSFEISNKSIVGSKVNVSYTVYDENGDPMTDELGQPLTSLKNAGKYTVKMNVSLIEGKNYQPIPPIVRTFEIKKAQYDISKIYLDASLSTYDGLAHKILVSIPEGHAIKPEDIHYEYRLGDELLQVDPNVGVIDAGEYTVKAVFFVRDQNYEQIPYMQATLVIEKQRVDISSVGFDASKEIEYSGDFYEPDFITLQDIGSVELLSYSDRRYYKLDSLGNYVLMADGEAPKNAGSYRCVIDLAILDADNYVLQGGGTEKSISFDFVIAKKDIDLYLVKFDNYEGLVYKAMAQVPTFDYSAYTSLITADSPRYFQLNGQGGYDEMTTRPFYIGSYRCLVTVRVIDTENYSFPGGVISIDLVCDYDIGTPPSIDVSALVALDPIPKVYKYQNYGDNDILPEIKATAQQRVAEMLPDEAENMVLWYHNAINGSGVNKITEKGEYMVLLISTDGRMLFDGTSYQKSVAIMRVVVCEIDWELDGDTPKPIILGYSNKNGFAELGLKVSVVISDGVAKATLEVLPGYEEFWTEAELRSLTPRNYIMTS